MDAAASGIFVRPTWPLPAHAFHPLQREQTERSKLRSPPRATEGTAQHSPVWGSWPACEAAEPLTEGKSKPRSSHLMTPGGNKNKAASFQVTRGHEPDQTLSQHSRLASNAIALAQNAKPLAPRPSRNGAAHWGHALRCLLLATQRSLQLGTLEAATLQTSQRCGRAKQSLPGDTLHQSELGKPGPDPGLYPVGADATRRPFRGCL